MDESAQNHYERAKKLCEIARWPETIREARKCLSIEPHHYRALCLISRSYLELGDCAQSLKFSEKAIAAEPQQEWGYRLQVHVYRKKKKLKKALKYAHECVRADPQGIYSLSTLASVQLDLKKLSEAARTAETIRSLAPDSFEAHEMMGYVALNGSKIKEALIHFERALKISPESADTLSIYAWTLYVKAQRLGAGRKKRELLKNAIKVFELSLQTNPTSISTKANLKKAIDLYLLTDNVSILTMISILLITIPVLLIHKLNLETPAAINILEKPPDLFIIIILMLIEIHILGFVTGGNRAIRTLPPKSRFFIESQSQSIHKLPFLILYALFLLVPIGVFIWRLSNYGIGSVSELTVFDWISLLTASAVFGYYAKFLRGELRKSKLWNRLKLTAEKE